MSNTGAVAKGAVVRAFVLPKDLVSTRVEKTGSISKVITLFSEICGVIETNVPVVTVFTSTLLP